MSARRRKGVAVADDLLMIDVGNSKLQGLLMRAGRERWRWRVDYADDSERWSRQSRAGLQAARALDGTSAPVCLASVAPRRTAVVERQLKALGWRRVRRLSHRDAWPFASEVERPETLGIDRLANVAGLVALGLRAGVAVDAGTAITIDVLARGVHHGGLILPGTHVWSAALHTHTAQLPEVGWDPHAPALGSNTREALRAGLRHGLAGAVRAVLETLRGEHGSRMPVVFTGGDGAILKSACALDLSRTEPDLIFAGMRCVLEARR